MGGLGNLIVNIGINQRFPTATLVGVGLVVVLSVVIDALLLFGQRRLTPWSTARGA
jgi:ABC-type proline/glycine betaine transport system permease subunit